MKSRLVILTLLIGLSAQAQKIEYQNIKLGEVTIPSMQPLPKDYRNYEFMINIDSVSSFLAGYYYDRLNSNITYAFSFQGYNFVEEKGDFKIELVLGPMNMMEDGPEPKAKKTNNADTGYIYRMVYTMPIDVLIKNKYGKILNKIPIRSENFICEYIFGPNYGLKAPETVLDKKGNRVEVPGSLDWNQDEVFKTSSEAVSKFSQYRNVLFGTYVTDNVIDLFWSRILQATTIMHIERRPYYNTGIFTVAKKDRGNKNYKDFDSAYLCFVKALNNIKQNPYKKDTTVAELNKCLNIYKAAYDTADYRVNDELKNALAFNIANIYYMLGNAEEGKKYEALYTIRDKDEVIKPKNALTNNATAGRNETLVVNEEFWCPADKYKLLFKVEYPTIISSASNGNN